MHSSHVLREGARPEVGRNTLGHTSIDVTQNALSRSELSARHRALVGIRELLFAGKFGL
jgi:hypothetical protein